MADSSAATTTVATCQSYGNNLDPERFSTLPVAKLDADEHSSNNGLKSLQPTCTTGYPYQPQQLNESIYKNKTAYISVTHARCQALTLNSGGSQQDDFRSLNLTDHLEKQNSSSEKIIYKNQNNTVNLKQDSISWNENEKTLETSPVAVSESDDEDNNENDVSLLPSTHNTDDYAKATLLMANHFTTSAMRYRQVPTATVIYSDPELACFSINDEVILSEELTLCRKLKKGGNGEYLLYEKKEFNKLCQLKIGPLLPILAYLLEPCNCGDKNCKGFTGYLIMEYLPIGDGRKISNDLKRQLLKAIRKRQNEENVMAYADRHMWQDCQFSWQYQNSLILKYQSALVKLISNAIKSLNWFHKQGLLHLDIKADNFLIQKRCDHKDVFDCGCSFIDFDFVLVDYDYAHEEGTDIQDPRHTGTLQYRALPLLFHHDDYRTIKAHYQFDYYSLCVMIISIFCGNDWCMRKLEEWRQHIKNSVCIRKYDIKAADEISELATSRLIADMRCEAHLIFGPKIKEYVQYVECKLQESIKHFYDEEK